MTEQVAIVVVGGGFYGARLSLALAARGVGRVVLIEREAGLMRRASFVNQARLHNGYHYPRAPLTGAAARRNFRRFLEEYRFAITTDVPMLYAIARQSRVSADQFLRFCEEIGAPCAPAASAEARLFDAATVEAVFAVEEFALNAALIAADTARRLAKSSVECRFGTAARVVALDADVITVEAGREHFVARHVLNCTYGELDMVGVPLRHRVKKEVAEVAMIRPPPALSRLAVTVMDGPFFSTMPFPALGCHSLTHVRYTPSHTWVGPGQPPAPGPSQALMMLRDAARYLPSIEGSTLLPSLYEVKALLEITEQNDARPVLVETSPASPRVTSVLGSKINHVYEVEAVLAERDWA